MPTNPNQEHPFTFHPLTPERWNDFEALFGPRGACGGCWCMWWRIKRSDFDHQKGDANRLACNKSSLPAKSPACWHMTASQAAHRSDGARWPRAQAFPALERSRILKRVDDQPVWSAVCFFIAKTYRRQGLTVSLLRAAVEYARQAGAKIVEGYPDDPRESGISRRHSPSPGWPPLSSRPGLWKSCAVLRRARSCAIILSRGCLKNKVRRCFLEDQMEITRCGWANSGPVIRRIPRYRMGRAGARRPDSV